MLRLALPVVLTYLGLMLMGVVDLLFVGRVSAAAIGAVGVGTSIFSWCMVFGLGLLAGLDYLVSYSQGSGRAEDGYRALVQALLASLAYALPGTAAMIVIARHLDLLGITPDVRPLAQGYLEILAWSLWPTLAFGACRQYLTARGVALPAMVILVLANVLNAAINYALVFGRWGAPALGSDGSAIATVVSRVAMALAIAACLLVLDRRGDRLATRVPWKLDRPVMREFLRLGLPSAFQMTFEVGVFALSTTLAARLAADSLAAHQIVLNIASLTFMVPLGVGSATAVLVGQALGRGDPLQARRSGWHGMSLGVGYMALSCAVLLLFAHPLLSLFTADPSVRAIAARILLVAALFQLSDGTQAVATGALRGLGETRGPMLANLGGHWGIGLPVGLLLCFHLGWGLFGLWIGLSLGLTTVAGLLLAQWKLKSGERVREAGVGA